MFEIGRKSDFRPEKNPTTSLFDVPRCGGFVIFIFHGGTSRKIRANFGLNSTLLRGVIHAGLSDQMECGTSCGTA